MGGTPVPSLKVYGAPGCYTNERYPPWGSETLASGECHPGPAWLSLHWRADGGIATFRLHYGGVARQLPAAERLRRRHARRPTFRLDRGASRAREARGRDSRGRDDHRGLLQGSAAHQLERHPLLGDLLPG